MRPRFRTALLAFAVGMTVHPSPARADYSWEELRKLLSSRAFTSIEELVDALPEELRKNAILQSGTESPQAASPEAPRVLLHSDDAKFVLGIAGGPGGRPLSPIIEVAQFDDRTSRIEPHAIELKQGGPARVFEDPARLFPPGHPKNCARCHGAAFKHIWDSYPFWPQSYGAIHRRAHLTHLEKQNFEAFLQKNGNQGIYKSLVGLKNATLETFSERNHEFTRLLATLNERRIVASVRDNPAFRRQAPRMLAAFRMNADEDFGQLLPEELRPLFKETYPRYLREIREAVNAQAARKLELYRKMGHGDAGDPPNFDLETAYLSARLRFLAQLAGVDTSGWATTRAQGTYSFTNGGVTLSAFNEEIKQLVAEDDPELIRRLQALADQLLRRSPSYPKDHQKLMQDLMRGPSGCLLGVGTLLN